MVDDDGRIAAAKVAFLQLLLLLLLLWLFLLLAELQLLLQLYLLSFGDLSYSCRLCFTASLVLA